MTHMTRMNNMAHRNIIPKSCTSCISLPARSSKDFTFFNNPRCCKLEQYKRAIIYFINKIKNDKNVVSIYQIGGISCPGISDIDLVIFIRAGAKTNTKKFKIQKLTKQRQYLYYHDPFIVPDNLAKHIHNLIPVFSLKHLHGKKFNFEKDSETNKLITLIDLVNLLYPKEFLMPYLKKKIDTRSMLCRLSAFKYVIQLAQNIAHCKSNKHNEWNRFIERIALLRSNWFKLNKSAAYKELVDLLRTAIKISFQITEEVNGFLKTKYFNESKGFNKDHENVFRRKKMIILNGYSNLYLPKYDSQYALEKMVLCFSQLKVFVQVLPSTFLLHLLYLRKSKGKISTIVKNKFNTTTYRMKIFGEDEINATNEKIIKKDKLINDYFRFLNLQAVSYGHFISYGFTSGNLINKLATNLKLCLKTIYLKTAIAVLNIRTNLWRVRRHNCLKK